MKNNSIFYLSEHKYSQNCSIVLVLVFIERILISCSYSSWCPEIYVGYIKKKIQKINAQTHTHFHIHIHVHTTGMKYTQI